MKTRMKVSCFFGTRFATSRLILYVNTGVAKTFPGLKRCRGQAKVTGSTATTNAAKGSTDQQVHG